MISTKAKYWYSTGSTGSPFLPEQLERKDGQREEHADEHDERGRQRLLERAVHAQGVRGAQPVRQLDRNRRPRAHDDAGQEGRGGDESSHRGNSKEIRNEGEVLQPTLP